VVTVVAAAAAATAAVVVVVVVVVVNYLMACNQEDLLDTKWLILSALISEE